MDKKKFYDLLLASGLVGFVIFAVYFILSSE